MVYKQYQGKYVNEEMEYNEKSERTVTGKRLERSKNEKIR